MAGLSLIRALGLAACVAMLSGGVSLAESPIRQLTNTSAANVRPAWSPDHKRIAFQSNRDGPYHIYVMDADGTNVRRLTNGDVDDRHPAWSPDGKYVVVDSGDALRREIWIIEVATLARTQVTRLGAITSFPSWSPDGRRISFYLYRSGAMDLWLAGRDGSGAAPLTRDLATESNKQCTFACHGASWSPDGGRIAFSDGDSARVLLMVSQFGSAPAPISPDDEKSHFPVYLSDGRIVYVSEHISLEQSWTDLWAIDPLETNAARGEVAGGVQAQGPFELSTDGRQLLFSSPRSGNFEIYSVTLDEAGKAALATRAEKPSASGVGAQQATAPRAAPAGGLVPPDTLPYAAGVAVLAFVIVTFEVVTRMRRRGRTGR